MITELAVERLPEVRDVWRSLHRHHSEMDKPPGWRPRDSEAAWRAWLDRAEIALMGADTGAAYIHTSAPGIDGLALVAILDPEQLERPVLTPAGLHAELVTLVVGDDVRGTGVGAGLYRAATDWAREQGAVTMHVDTRADNLDGLRFYERQGARPAFVQLMQPL